MHPVWEFLNGLEGFECAAFYITAGVAVVISGFFLEYLLQNQSFGVILNSLLVAVGLFLGLYVRFVYVRPSAIPFPDPMLSVLVVLGVTVALVGTLAMFRNRFY